MFNAWGAIIKVEDGAGNTLTGLTVLDRGYTGHEHLQSVGLINMNARLYDPMLHRFLQTDNYIQDPTNTQNYKPYGYVLNNPLLYIDPSGNKYGDGKDCFDCGLTPGQQIGGGNIIKNLANNWDDWGVKNWANKNINGDKISQWWKSKISFNNLFGGGKNSGPPPNRSSYVSLNTYSRGNFDFKQNYIVVADRKGKTGLGKINEKEKYAEWQKNGQKVIKAVDNWLANNTYIQASTSLKIGTYYDVGIKHTARVTLGEYNEWGYSWSNQEGLSNFKTHKIVAGGAMEGGAQYTYDAKEEHSFSIGYGFFSYEVSGESQFIGINMNYSQGIGIGGEGGFKIGIKF